MEDVGTLSLVEGGRYLKPLGLTQCQGIIEKHATKKNNRSPRCNQNPGQNQNISVYVSSDEESANPTFQLWLVFRVDDAVDELNVRGEHHRFPYLPTYNVEISVLI